VQTVFITGCATGFGHRLAARCLAQGHRVIATDQRLEGWPEALGAPRDDLLVLPLDVRRVDQVKAAALEATSWGPVDILVNNAGYALFGTQEELDLMLVRDLFDVNVLGAARVTQALLPALRQSKGTIVQLSSVAGRTVFTESGFYAATKYAIEAMTEALFQETCTFGIKVRLIQPGSFATRFLSTATQASPEPPDDSAYSGLRDDWMRRKLAVLEPPQDPSAVVDAILASFDAPEPFLRIPVGPDAERIIGLRDALKPDVWSHLMGDRAGLKAAHGAEQIPSPQELLVLLDAGRPVPAAVRTAHRLLHLEHWAETETGRAALDRLRSSPT
jgi:NAD(P)-dependent dehydrogenase (short-subunit alcohol dehydrogenase family)